MHAILMTDDSLFQSCSTLALMAVRRSHVGVSYELLTLDRQ